MSSGKEILRSLYVKALRLQRDPSTIPDNGLIQELGIDSITSLEILIWVEEEFKIVIDDEDLSSKLIDSLETLWNYVNTRLECQVQSNEEEHH